MPAKIICKNLFIKDPQHNSKSINDSDKVSQKHDHQSIISLPKNIETNQAESIREKRRFQDSPKCDQFIFCLLAALGRFWVPFRPQLDPEWGGGIVLLDIMLEDDEKRNPKNIKY